MKKPKLNSISLLLCLILVLPLAACGQPNATAPKTPPAIPQTTGAIYPVTITNYDSSENPVAYTYKKVPERVVITHPGATELLLELGQPSISLPKKSCWNYSRI
ncbi:MAG: ABC-type transporter, periplasmic subunit [Pelosinus sp.]|nr:ABC-type transporter, periplasmic subunit [Pelosinus sp.]